jgi:hypothetical protein
MGSCGRHTRRLIVIARGLHYEGRKSLIWSKEKIRVRNLQFADLCESQETEHAGRRTDNSGDGDLDERGTVTPVIQDKEVSRTLVTPTILSCNLLTQPPRLTWQYPTCQPQLPGSHIS